MRHCRRAACWASTCCGSSARHPHRTTLGSRRRKMPATWPGRKPRPRRSCRRKPGPPMPLPPPPRTTCPPSPAGGPARTWRGATGCSCWRRAKPWPRRRPAARASAWRCGRPCATPDYAAAPSPRRTRLRWARCWPGWAPRAPRCGCCRWKTCWAWPSSLTCRAPPAAILTGSAGSIPTWVRGSAPPCCARGPTHGVASAPAHAIRRRSHEGHAPHPPRKCAVSETTFRIDRASALRSAKLDPRPCAGAPP
ncbi:protein of unknown function (plasmid) [Cupriavidus neocaledonicus]|uniref:4-alpha-glucanotransferase (Modular protein) n=1 Tax=Cupriavidus neocaledonicus TaxID=1040979 RepID=A0A375HSI3_9BURK|nr:4-alpha-glucanotransferase (modular protein) [Cupriavidus neocaledonicus]SPD59710.1 protein of unknown function [Cupriavidus neocaledonicus]